LAAAERNFAILDLLRKLALLPSNQRTKNKGDTAMKFMLLTSILMASLNCFADNYYVAPGFYSGNGTWTDNLGASGNWTMSFNFTSIANGLHEEFVAEFDDGRSYEGSADVVMAANSNFTYLTTVAGSQVTIGQGVSSPGFYQVGNLILNQNESIMEFGDFSNPEILRRWGTLSNKLTGRSTMYVIKEIKR
jgi:hypothetical protein